MSSSQSIARQQASLLVLANPSMCARRFTQPAAASFDPGSSARLATSANSTRSVRGSRLRPASSPAMTVSIPSLRHSASRTSMPPTGCDEVNASSAVASPVALRRASPDRAARSATRPAEWLRPGRAGPRGRRCAAPSGGTSSWSGPTRCGSAAGTAPRCRPCFAASTPARARVQTLHEI